MKVVVLNLNWGNHPSSYALTDFTNACESFRIEVVNVKKVSLRARIVKKLRFSWSLTNRIDPEPLVLTPLMGLKEGIIAESSLKGHPVPFIWDCWEPDWDQWTRIFLKYKIKLVFLTSSDSARFFTRSLTNIKFVHVPEAIGVDRFERLSPKNEKLTDILELGRRYEVIHKQLKSISEKHGFYHLYEEQHGKLIFPTQEGLMQGIANAKILVCFPRSVTHPDSTGRVETLTQRYFEGMLSRCLILGQCPRELLELFGYNPVIEIDSNNLESQIVQILKNLDMFKSLLDKNEAMTRTLGSWNSRLETISGVLNNHMTKQ